MEPDGNWMGNVDAPIFHEVCVVNVLEQGVLPRIHTDEHGWGMYKDALVCLVVCGMDKLEILTKRATKYFTHSHNRLRGAEAHPYTFPGLSIL